MRNEIKDDIGQYVQLSEKEFEHYYNQLIFKTFEKKENLLSSGQVCSNAFFILDGCIRYYTLVEEEEHTGQFFFEGTWYSDYGSFLFGEPSQQTIQAIEKTRVAILSKKTLDGLFEAIPKFERFGRLIAEQAFLGLKQRTESLTNLSALGRYNLLVKNRPKVIQRVPQKYIASYLNIKPQSLSRIRSKAV